jgi:hypothetical protein
MSCSPVTSTLLDHNVSAISMPCQTSTVPHPRLAVAQRFATHSQPYCRTQCVEPLGTNGRDLCKENGPYKPLSLILVFDEQHDHLDE